MLSGHQVYFEWPNKYWGIASILEMYKFYGVTSQVKKAHSCHLPTVAAQIVS